MKTKELATGYLHSMRKITGIIPSHQEQNFHFT